MHIIAKLDDWLVEGWRKFYTWWSVWLHTIGTSMAAVLVFVPQMPAELQQWIPLEYRIAAIGLWYIGGLWARLKAQKGKS